MALWLSKQEKSTGSRQKHDNYIFIESLQIALSNWKVILFSLKISLTLHLNLVTSILCLNITLDKYVLDTEISIILYFVCLFQFVKVADFF